MKKYLNPKDAEVVSDSEWKGQRQRKKLAKDKLSLLHRCLGEDGWVEANRVVQFGNLGNCSLGNAFI